MAVETLAIAIRTNPDIKGMACGDQEHKCTLYADDLLLYINSPLTSTPVIYGVLNSFSRISGLKVNMYKATALNITVPPELLSHFINNFAFSWAPRVIPYLGIYLTPDIKDLFKANYPPMITKCRGDLQQWSRCGLSWLGKVHAVKMTLLPRLLYLFQSLPIPLPKSFLGKFQSEIIRFVWRNKGYRCPSKILLRLKSQGGFGLPDLWGYYQAAQLSQILMIFSKGPKPEWLFMERWATPLNTINFLLWCDSKQRPAIMAPTLSHSISLSSKLFTHTSIISPLRPLSHIFHNIKFPPELNIQAFRWWTDKGLYRIGHFLTKTGPLTLSYCKHKLDMPNMEQFRFTQISHFLNAI